MKETGKAGGDAKKEGAEGTTTKVLAFASRKVQILTLILLQIQILTRILLLGLDALYKKKYIRQKRNTVDAKKEGGEGTQFTCFTGAKVQILTQELRRRGRGARSTKVLALLVQKHSLCSCKSAN
jgi:hypothetical protein